MANAIQMGKKAFTWSVVVTTILWSMGIAALVPMVAHAAEECPTLEAGDLFKVPGNSAVYLLNSDMERMYFPKSEVYRTWYEDFSGVQEIPTTCVDAYPAPSSAPFGVNFRAGSALVKVQISPSVYVVEPGNKISKIGSEQVARELYGSDWAKKVYDIADPFWPNYVSRGDELTESTPHDGMFVKTSGSSDVYYVENGERMMVDGTVKSSEVQTVSQSVLDSVPEASGSKTAASVYSDPTQGAGDGVVGPGEEEGEGTVSSGTLTVALAADTPSGTFAVKSAVRVPFTKVRFTASGGDVVIKSFMVKRGGNIAVDSDFSKINVVDENGDLLNESGKTLNSDSLVTFTEDITIKSGQTETYTLVGDMASSVGGGNIPSLELYSIDTDSTVVGNLPLDGNAVTMNSGVTLGTVIVAEGTSVGNSTKQVGTTDVHLASLKVTVATEDFQIERIMLNNSGTSSDDDVQNIELRYNNNVIATGELKDKYINFDLSACGSDCMLEKGKNRTFDVYGDLVAGSSRTVNLDVKRVSHVLAKDLNSNYYRSPTNSASALTNTITISQGKINVTKVNDVQTQDVPEDVSNVALASWNFHVTGEAVDISTLTFRITTTGTAAPEAFDSLILYDAEGNALTGGVDGVGSTAGVGYATSTDTITLQPGDNIVTLKANIDSTPVADDTVTFAIDMRNTTNFDATGVDSGDTITLGTYATPQSAVSANAQTIKTAALRVTTLSTPPAQTYAPGTSGVLVAKVQLDAAGSSEDMKVTQLIVSDTTSATAITQDLQNIRLWVDKDGDSFNGSGTVEVLAEVQNGSDATAGNDENFTFNLSGDDQFVVKKGAKLVVEVRVDIAGGATAGTHTFATASANQVTANGVDTNSSVSEVIDSASGQAMTVGTSGGTVQVSSDSANPTARLFAGGTTGATLASFVFLATSTEDVEIEQIMFTQRVTDTSSSSYNDYSLLYLEDEDGVRLGSVQPTSTTPVIKFANDAFVVDKDDTDGMIVYLKADLSVVASNQNVTVGGHAVGFNIAAAGDIEGKGDLTGSGSVEYLGSDAPNGNTHYLYAAVPTITQLPIGSTLTNGVNDLFKFKVTANTGDIGVAKFTFDVTTSSVTVTNFEVYDITNSPDDLLFSQSADSTSIGGGGFLEVNLNTSEEGGLSQGAREVRVSKTAPRTFVLRGTVSGASSGDSISTRLGGDAAFADASSTNGSSTSLGATLMSTVTNIDSGLHDDFIWSDRHLGTHATTTNDWTNGYLVSGLNSNSSTPAVLSL